MFRKFQVLADVLRIKSTFYTNVITLMGGAAFAQLFSMATAPVLTRIYAPEDFGTFSLFAGIASITTIFSTGRYELGIMLPKTSKRAMNVFVASVCVTFLISIFVWLCLILFKQNIITLLKAPQLKGWIYFLALSTIVGGMHTNLSYWSIRQARYKSLSIAKVFQSLSVAVISIALGIGGLGIGGLIVGRILGQGMAVAKLGKSTWKEDKYFLFKSFNLSRIRAALRTHIKFPKFNMPSALISTLSLEAPVFMLSLFFSKASVGHYALAYHVLFMPTGLVKNAIGQVFMPKSMMEARRAKLVKLLNKIINRELLFIIPFSLLFLLMSEKIFKHAFGPKWLESGNFAKLLLPYLITRFVGSSISTLPSMLGHQEKMLWWSFFRFAGSYLSLYVGSSHSIESAIFYFSVFNCFAYVILILKTYYFAYKNDKKGNENKDS